MMLNCLSLIMEIVKVMLCELSQFDDDGDSESDVELSQSDDGDSESDVELSQFDDGDNNNNNNNFYLYSAIKSNQSNCSVALYNE